MPKTLAPTSPPKRWPAPGRVVLRALLAWAVAVGGGEVCRSQPNAATSTTHADAVHWKSDLFLVPYQWTGGAAVSASSVRLYSSQDRGATWQMISEAQPQVKAFSYRAPGDGEYWFAVRTIDAQGRAWPADGLQPELRVIVDKESPRIEDLEAMQLEDGKLAVRWKLEDTFVNPGSLRVEGQHSATGPWELLTSSAATPLIVRGANQFAWLPPGERAPAAVRISIADLAGNIAYATADVVAAPAVAVTSAAPSSDAMTTPTSGWASAASPVVLAEQRASAAQNRAGTTQDQPWPAEAAPLNSYRLYDQVAGIPADGGTRYGNPAASVARAPMQAEVAGPVMESGETETTVAPIEPFRQVSLRRLPAINAEEASTPGPATAGGFEVPASANSTYVASTSAQPANVKHVNARTFALEYELSDLGGLGVSRVELWGSRDEGKSWRRYAQDDDLRSPIETTVEGEGRYGFRLVAESAGGAPAAAPQPGDRPELWLVVDLNRPFAELTAVEAGDHERPGQLVLRWRAEDENLEARPISLYYSSRPGGPWSVIAAKLENSGEYAWRVERHVPDRCYLRLEVRDLAGNQGAYQTLEPIAIEHPDPRAELRAAVPLGGDGANVGLAPR